MSSAELALLSMLSLQINLWKSTIYRFNCTKGRVLDMKNESEPTNDKSTADRTFSLTSLESSVRVHANRCTYTHHPKPHCMCASILGVHLWYDEIPRTPNETSIPQCTWNLVADIGNNRVKIILMYTICDMRIWYPINYDSDLASVIIRVLQNNGINPP